MVKNPIPTISIIVPTRNEAANIRPLLARLTEAMAGLTTEIFFVDDSTDNTAAVISAVAAEQTTLAIRWLARPAARRNGLSGAVVAGLERVSGDWVGVMDADLQHPPEMMRQLYRHGQETGADIIVGSRQGTLFGPSGLSRARAFTSQTLTIMARTLFPQVLKNVSDPLTGLFLVRRAKLDPSALRPDGFKILLEILVRTPNLRVSELHFAFAPRHSGQSKADIQEGVRFFRHLLRLRLTANRWFARYAFARSFGVLAQLLLLFLFTGRLGVHYLLGAIIAAELTILGNFWLTEHWIFTDAAAEKRSQRFSRFWLVNQLYLILRLPLLYVMVAVVGWHYLPAAGLAIVAGGMVKYGASEQWIWNRGLSWQRPFYRYDIHGLLGIESQAAMPDLAYFRVGKPLETVHIRLRVDRHGTPSCQPGAICYDESLGRFGFGIAVMPAACTEVVIAPALEHAPYLLYKSVLEPLLRWRLAAQGVMLLPVAATAVAGRATLIVSAGDWAKSRAILQQVRAGDASFMGDEGVLLRADGRVFALPRPISLTARTLPLSAGGGLRSRLKAAFYSDRQRRLGIWLSRRRLPIATLNMLAQRLLPPPKTSVSALQPPLDVAAEAALARVFVMQQGVQAGRPLTAEAAAATLVAAGAAATGFPPYPNLMAALQHESMGDLPATEAAILAAALTHVVTYQSIDEQKLFI